MDFCKYEKSSQLNHILDQTSLRAVLGDKDYHDVVTFILFGLCICRQMDSITEARTYDKYSRVVDIYY